MGRPRLPSGSWGAHRLRASREAFSQPQTAFTQGREDSQPKTHPKTGFSTGLWKTILLFCILCYRQSTQSVVMWWGAVAAGFD